LHRHTQKVQHELAPEPSCESKRGQVCGPVRTVRREIKTEHLDRWDESSVKFILGYDANKAVVRKAEELPQSA
jgi:hypothetical protein